jgi:hypothetical protein
MTAWPLVCAATVTILGAGACNSRFVFDNRPEAEDLDAGTDGAAVAPDLPANDEPVTCSTQTAACLCSGTLCSCARQQWCRFTGEVCVAGTQCAFLCHNAARCDGTCLGNCKLECEHGSTCAMTIGDHAYVEGESSTLTVTVGATSKIHCENNATCHVRCTGSCTLECQSGARCDLRCPGDSAPRSADQGGSCPG